MLEPKIGMGGPMERLNKILHSKNSQNLATSVSIGLQQSMAVIVKEHDEDLWCGEEEEKYKNMPWALTYIDNFDSNAWRTHDIYNRHGNKQNFH